MSTKCSQDQVGLSASRGHALWPDDEGRLEPCGRKWLVILETIEHSTTSWEAKEDSKPRTPPGL